ncbi:MAG: hypothetical protein U0Q21_07860 [Dermatophilaceae bacterium]
MDSVAWLLGAGSLVAVLMLIQLSNLTAELRRRLAHQDAAIERIAAHLGVPSAELLIRPRVEEELTRGHTIAAVKVYRDATGLSLRESKEAIDRIAAERSKPGSGNGAPMA